MKKIIGLTIAALLLIATVAGGTWAYFQDTETSANNNITAGTLDLKINTADANVDIIAALENKKPGDADMTPGPFGALSNAGSLAGKLSIASGAVTNTESTGSTEFENDAIGGAGVGELGAQVKIAPWIDLDSDGTFDAAADIALKSDGSTSTAALQWDYVNAFASKNYSNVVASFAAAGTARFYLPWEFENPGSAVNTAQGDKFSIGFTFTLDQ